MANVAIADRLDVSVATVSLWRLRFFAEGLTGLAERKRSGRPRTFPPLVQAEATALACELPTRALTAAPLRLALPAGSASAGSASAGSASADSASADSAAPSSPPPAPPEVPSSDRPPAEALPAGGAGLARWDAVEIARELVARGTVASISASTVRRWLRAAALQPWRHRSWIFPRDPQFAVTGGRVSTVT
jgi:hypothetical protein